MKIALITDIHHGPIRSGMHNGVQQKLVTKALPLLKDFINTINNDQTIDFVVNLGDFIEDVNDKEKDIHYFKQVLAEFKEIKIPVHHLIGNHDQKTLTENNLRGLLGYEKFYYSFTREDYKFICLYAKVVGNHREREEDIRAIIEDEQLRWLENELNTENKVIVFCHYSCAEVNLDNNVWFEGAPQFALLQNRSEIRGILSKSNNVKAYINGHIHHNSITYHNNIPFITQQSIVENFNQDGLPAASYSIVELSENSLNLSMYGNDRMNLSSHD
jgi:3',5'-cyclic AMP phosphodiesterase CpdA